MLITTLSVSPTRWAAAAHHLRRPAAPGDKTVRFRDADGTGHEISLTTVAPDPDAERVAYAWDPVVAAIGNHPHFIRASFGPLNLDTITALTRTGNEYTLTLAVSYQPATRRAYCEVTTRREDQLMNARPDHGPLQADIVAYKHPDLADVLLCPEHGEGWAGLIPLTAHDLPYVGFCSWGTDDDMTVCGNAFPTKEQRRSRR
ncbi:hypothetical protein ACFRR7_36490 [Streptomyces sp. NPDC056909]|uniref:hypothetical protein n=1 Tax=Streptomyces sp. NPDC056909 TaxID=3345963 RepID=UPI00367E3F2C